MPSASAKFSKQAQSQPAQHLIPHSLGLRRRGLPPQSALPISIDAPPLHRLHGPSQKRIPHQDDRRADCDGYGDLPEIPLIVFDAREVREVHAEVAGDESQGQENDGDDRELLHGLVLPGRDGVEDQIDHAPGRLVQLVERLRDQDAVVFHVAEIRMCHGTDLDACDGAEGFVREDGSGNWLAFVVAESGDETGDGADEISHGGDLGCDNVQARGMLYGWFREHIEFEFADYVLVGCSYGNSKIDDGVNDGLSKHGSC